MSELGFNVVRLGVIWAGIEPGSGGPNQPGICTLGAAKDPGMWNQKVADVYLARVRQVVNELGRHHIYSLIDMHQDVWSSVFGGEGAPPWAVCTDGIPITPSPGRWSHAYGNPSEIAAWNNFWYNDVVGGLQQQYQRAWGAVAKEFSKSPWVVGYDPINEPSAMTDVVATPEVLYSASLSCLYAGSGGQTFELDGKTPIPCPIDVPKVGLIKTIESADHEHLVFPEVDNASGPQGEALFLGTTRSLPRTVYNFHDYCPQRSGVTGNPTDLPACSNHETTTMINNMDRRSYYATDSQPLGPAIMMTEFGATSTLDLASLLALDAESNNLSWTWWSWRYYDDPTGSSEEALIQADDQLSPIAPALTATYAPAIAGTPVDASTNISNGQFSMIWMSSPSITAPTTVFVDPLQFPYGYCTYVEGGGTITSKPDAQILTITNPSITQLVGVRVVPGKCLGGRT